VGLPGQLDVKVRPRKLNVGVKGGTRFLRDRQGLECKPFRHVKCKYLVFSRENLRGILPSPRRQKFNSDLKPGFDGNHAPGSVVNGNVVHIQRCSNRRPNCVQRTFDGECKQGHA
jgi:hypothetical protein